MIERINRATVAGVPTRRQVIAGVATALGAMAVSSVARGGTEQAMTEAESTGADKARTYLHQEVDLKAPPQRIYEILLDSKQFGAFSGEAAEISREAGGAFSMFGEKIVGQNVELVPSQRIVQAWRAADWKPGLYTIVKFEFKAKGSQSTVILDHTGFPEGAFVHLNQGWKEHYWERLEKYLG